MWLNHLETAYNTTFQPRHTDTKPLSLNLRDIMSYCGKNNPSSINNDSSSEASENPAIPSPADPFTPIEESHISLSPLSTNSSRNELQQQQRRKINLLNKALYEYIARLGVHHKNIGPLDVQRVRTVALNLGNILEIDNFVPNRMWLNQFKSRYDFTFAQGVPLRAEPVPQSLDLHDIVSHCRRQQEQPQATETQEEKESSCKVINEAIEKDDDFVATDEIKVEEAQLEISPTPPEHNDLKRPSPAVAASPLPLKKKWISSSVLPSTCPKKSSCNSLLPISLRSYENALRLLKLLDELVLLDENYRAIGLLSQLEKIFEEGVAASKFKIETQDMKLPSSFDSYKDAQFALKPLEDFLLIEENYEAIGLLSKLWKVFRQAQFKQRAKPLPNPANNLRITN